MASIEEIPQGLSCSCKRSDPWRCAVEQRSSAIACRCGCHRRELNPETQPHAMALDWDNS